MTRPVNFAWRAYTSQRAVYSIIRALSRLARRRRPQAGSGTPRRVAHVSPAFFGEQSYLGGGERYAVRLAEAVAEQIETVLVTFGSRRETVQQGRLTVEIYPTLKLLNGAVSDPLCYDFLRELAQADVIHCHQYRAAVTALSLCVGRILHKRVFVTDAGGGGLDCLAGLALHDLVDAFLPVSEFGARMLPPHRHRALIYGGVSEDFLQAESGVPRKRRVLFVGRLLPHKGINYLIEGIDKDIPLDIVGRPYSPAYFQLLTSLAADKPVTFLTDATDLDLQRAYHRSLVTVLPSVYCDVYGTHYPMPELLGLVMLESMASGTPVICTDVGGMPEFVEHGVTGFIVPPNDSRALGERVRFLVDHPEIALRMGQNGRRRVTAEFTWDAVARRCLAAYSGEAFTTSPQAD